MSRWKYLSLLFSFKVHWALNYFVVLSVSSKKSCLKIWKNSFHIFFSWGLLCIQRFGFMFRQNIVHLNIFQTLSFWNCVWTWSVSLAHCTHMLYRKLWGKRKDNWHLETNYLFINSNVQDRHISDLLLLTQKSQVGKKMQEINWYIYEIYYWRNKCTVLHSTTTKIYNLIWLIPNIYCYRVIILKYCSNSSTNKRIPMRHTTWKNSTWLVLQYSISANQKMQVKYLHI